MSRLLFLLTVLVFGAFGVSGRQLIFSVEVSRLRVTNHQALVEYYVTVDGRSVRYANTPAGFEARVAVTFTVVDSLGGVRFAKKLLLHSPALADTLGARIPFRLHERVAVANGRYMLRWDGTDQVWGKGAPEIRVEMPLTVGYPAKHGVQVADIQLLESYAKVEVADIFTKGGYSLVGRTTDFYPAEAELLKFYTEVYHTDSRLGAGAPLVVRYRIWQTGEKEPVMAGERIMRQTAAEVIPVLATLNLGAVPSGNFELVVEAVAPDGRVLGSGKTTFQRSNPSAPGSAGAAVAIPATAASAGELANTFVADLDSAKLPHYLQSLRPVATSVEAAFIQTLAREGTSQQQRAYLYHFWEKQVGKDAAPASWAEYRKRIEYADAAFANKAFPAHETDCGRVYLQYGPPDQIFNERNDPQRKVSNNDVRPYLIWNYYKLRNVTTSSNQTNRTFVFFQKNLGDPSPRLIHSNAIGETNNPDWRSQIGDKFSGNSQFDRNAGGTLR